MPFKQSPAERKAAHRSGQSIPMASRRAAAALNASYDSNEAGILRSTLPVEATGGTLGANTPYWVYVGRAARDTTFNKILVPVTVAAVGTGGATVAIATSTTGPDRTSKSLTVRAISTSITLVGVGANSVAVNSDNLGFKATATDFLWVGINSNFGTTQVSVRTVANDYGTGMAGSSSAGALVVGSSYTCTVVAGLGTIAFDLVLSAV